VLFMECYTIFSHISFNPHHHDRRVRSKRIVYALNNASRAAVELSRCLNITKIPAKARIKLPSR